MGSLWGHLDEGFAFIILGFWWMYNACKHYIKVGGRLDFDAAVSFPLTFRRRTFNFEVYAKIIVSIVGLLIELFNGGVPVRFINEDGGFYRVRALQHVSIYTLFILHGAIDLLRYKKMMFIEGLEYLSLALAFAWYGMIFYFHTQTGHADKLEIMVHSLGSLWCFGAAISILWEHRTEDKCLPNYCRALMVLSLGTWFVHIPFYLYSSGGFPGESQNPLWDRNDVQNVQFIATMFGFHILVNITISLIMLAVIRLVDSNILGGVHVNSHVTFCRVPNADHSFEENTGLLDEEL